MTDIQSLLTTAEKCRTLADLNRVVRRLGRRLKTTLANLCRACNLRATGTKGELLFRLEGVLSEMYLKANGGRTAGDFA